MDSSEDTLVDVLRDIDILISTIGPRAQLAQIPLVGAAKKAGVKRFIPCGFTLVMPVGVHRSRDEKEVVYNLVKRLHLPYTIIDVGYWYQASFPELPSGKIDYAVSFSQRGIPGDGNVFSALTDVRDIGKYVACIIRDERTLNKMVFVYNELWTSNQIYDLLEKLSGETIQRKYSPTEEYERQLADADVKLNQNPDDFVARAQKVGAQYALSWGIRGENTPEFAKYLGYLDGKSLYPDLKFTSYQIYLEEVVSGKARAVYPELQSLLRKVGKESS
ncbi:hypothetical protein CLAIMM_15157 [Cladophialophora immunda]|nr:hypothetical protein CLAIMM_15157 [Cladophialophora immunda]